MWTKKPYGAVWVEETNTWEYLGGRWTISNGHLNFDIHCTVCGSRKFKNREPGNKPWIVTPDEADAYAEAILQLLNKENFHVTF